MWVCHGLLDIYRYRSIGALEIYEGGRLTGPRRVSVDGVVWAAGLRGIRTTGSLSGALSRNILCILNPMSYNSVRKIIKWFKTPVNGV